MNKEPSEPDLVAQALTEVLTSRRVQRSLARRFRWMCEDELDEIASRCFAKAWRCRAGCRANSVTKARAWIWSVVRSESKRHLHLRNNSSGDARDYEKTLSARPAQGQSVESRLEILDTIDHALGALSPIERRIYEAHHRDGWTYAEVSARLGLSDGTARSLCDRITRRLRTVFATDGSSGMSR